MMISIIVPVYNAEKYLEQSIESILNSTYRDFELILVDDGSTDASGEKCDSLAERDSRVSVIHKQNGGVSSARNAGLRAAQGEYVMFVDGDDLIHPQMIETLKTAIDSGNYDFSMVYGTRVTEGDAAVIESILKSETSNPSKYEISQHDYINRLITSGYERFWALSVVNKLFKKTLVDQLRFDETINVAEDFEWSMRLAPLIDRAIVVDVTMYIYIQHRGSAMQSGATEGLVKSVYVYKRSFDNLPAEYRSTALKQLYSYMMVIRRYSAGSSMEEEANKACREMYKLTVKEFLRSDNSWHSKLRSLLGYHFPGLYNGLLNMLEKRAFKKKQGQALD